MIQWAEDYGTGTRGTRRTVVLPNPRGRARRTEAKEKNQRQEGRRQRQRVLNTAKEESSGSRGNGRDVNRRVFEQLTTSSEAFSGLCAFGTQGATDVGTFSLRVAEHQRSSTSGFGPCGASEVDLLPIPLVSAKTLLKGP